MSHLRQMAANFVMTVHTQRELHGDKPGPMLFDPEVNGRMDKPHRPDAEMHSPNVNLMADTVAHKLAYNNPGKELQVGMAYQKLRNQALNNLAKPSQMHFAAVPYYRYDEPPAYTAEPAFSEQTVRQVSHAETIAVNNDHYSVCVMWVESDGNQTDAKRIARLDAENLALYGANKE